MYSEMFEISIILQPQKQSIVFDTDPLIFINN